MTFVRASKVSACVAILGFALCNVLAAAEPTKIPLWKDGAPGSETRMAEPEKREGSNVSNVHHPSITAFLPHEGQSTGTAIIIAPGGGHRKLCLGHEGDALASWFADRGIAAFVLRYRLCREDISVGMAKVYLQYKEAGVPSEMHVYGNAGHGFGYRPGTTSAAGDWPKRFCEWLVDSKLLSPMND